MEMPFDILNDRLGKLRDNGDIDFDNTAAAMDIDQDLQRKFVFIPQEEIDAVEIQHPTASAYALKAGDGPETIRANIDDNPSWLYNSAVHALALYQHLKALREQEARIEKDRAEKERLARRPPPGVYETHLEGEDEDYFTVIVDAQRLMWVPQASGGSLNMADDYDSGLAGNGPRWIMQHINLTDGTISK